jgi:hypothetical protein
MPEIGKTNVKKARRRQDGTFQRFLVGDVGIHDVGITPKPALD